MLRAPIVTLVAIVAALALLGAACAKPETDEPAVAPQPTPPATPDPELDAPLSPDAVTELDPLPEGEAVEVQISIVGSELEIPWDVAFMADGRVYVTERDSGRLLELGGDGAVDEVHVFPVDSAGEGGLLGLTADPAGERLYAYYTAAEDNRVVRLRPGDEPEPILVGIPKGGIHNGGRIAFGPDGHLFITTGDVGQPALSQDQQSLAGKILRVDPDGAPPQDNPEPGSPVYAWGIRNSQGLAWDADERLIVTEFGPDVDDALLRVEPGSDQGWGPDTAQAPAGQRPFPDPIDVRQPPEASWSGAAVMHEGAIPQWEGDLFATGLRGQRIWRYTLDEVGRASAAQQLLVATFGRLRHVVQAPDGALWVLTSNRDGRGAPHRDDDRVIRLGPAS